jgi:hypothetical protein
VATLGVAVFSVPGMKHVERCVQSVQWADDIVVLRIGEAVDPHRRRTDWVLHLWGEEFIEGELQKELLALRARPLSESRPGYNIAVRSYVLGRWVDGSVWGPSPSLRVARQIRRWPPTWCSGWKAERTAALSGTIRDDSTAELAFCVSQMNRIGSLWAEASDGEVASLGRTTVFSLGLFLRLVFRAGLQRDGFAGFTLSVLAAYAALLCGAKAWEKARGISNRLDGRETSEESIP